MNIKQIIVEAVSAYDGGDEAAKAYHAATGTDHTHTGSHDDSYYAQYGDHHVYVGYGSRQTDSSLVHVNSKLLHVPSFSDDAEDDMRDNSHFELASDEISRTLHTASNLNSEEKQAAHDAIIAGLRAQYE